MRTHDLCHVASIIDIQWSRPVKGVGGGAGLLNWFTCCKAEVDQKKCSSFEVADKHDVVLEVIDGRYTIASLFNLKI